MKNKLALAATLLSLALSSSAALAGVADLKTGTYNGRWCGYQAIFKIDSQDSGTWVFHGEVIFPTYDNLADELWIEQYEDNSLRMIRYLSADQAGVTQVVQTYAPSIKANNGRYPSFKVEQAHGPDCEGEITRFDMN